MSFFFAQETVNNKHKNVLGHSKTNTLSLQLIKSTTKNNVTNYSALVSPKVNDKFATLCSKVKRTFLSTHLNASITVEASFSLPLFVFAIISIMYFFNIIYIQITLQIQLENVARMINSFTCITTEANVELSDDESSLLEKVVIDTAGTIAIKELFLNEDIQDFVDNTLIVDGAKGLSFMGSDVTNTDYPLDLLLTYNIKMPFISEDLFSFKLTNRCYFKPFNGTKLSQTIFLHHIYVYVTEDGDTFHSNKFCSYISRFTQLKNLTELKSDYPYILPCSFCSKSSNLISRPTIGDIEYVYVTNEYDVYHFLDACTYLQRYLIRLSYEDAKNVYKPCSRCVVYTD